MDHSLFSLNARPTENIRNEEFLRETRRGQLELKFLNDRAQIRTTIPAATITLKTTLGTYWGWKKTRKFAFCWHDNILTLFGHGWSKFKDTEPSNIRPG